MCNVVFLSLNSLACVPVLTFRTSVIVLILLLRAKVLSRNPKVESSRFETRSGKKIQQLPNCWGCPRHNLEDGASLVLMRLSIALLRNELYFLNPFSNGPIIGQL